MNTFIKLGAAAGILALLIGVVLMFRAPTDTVTVTNPDGTQTVGAATGGDYLSQVYFRAGVLKGGLLATTSNATAETLTAGEFAGWLNSSEVSYIPRVVADNTITLPASTTLKAILQNAGDSQTFCLRNATTTADVRLIIAGGTGTNLLVASSTATAVGSAQLLSGKVACFTAVRQAYTSASFDIDVLMTAFK